MKLSWNCWLLYRSSLLGVNGSNPNVVYTEFELRMSTMGKIEPRESRLSSFLVDPMIMLLAMFDPMIEFHSPTTDWMFSMIW